MNHKEVSKVISTALEANPETVVRLATVPYHRELRHKGEVIGHNIGNRTIIGKPIKVSFVKTRGCLCLLLKNGTSKPIPVPCPSISGIEIP